MRPFWGEFRKYDLGAVVGTGGLIIWPGWNDPEIDPRELDLPWVVGIPDSPGRVLGWV
jgi:hypothetical protein